MFSTTEETNLGKLEGVGSTDHYHNSRLDDPDDKQVCVVWCGCERQGLLLYDTVQYVLSKLLNSYIHVPVQVTLFCLY